MWDNAGTRGTFPVGLAVPPVKRRSRQRGSSPQGWQSRKTLQILTVRHKACALDVGQVANLRGGWLPPP